MRESSADILPLLTGNKTDTEKVTAFIEVRVTPQRGQGF